MEKDFIEVIHKLLKDKINASVYVKIEDDSLSVKITKFNILWTYRCSNITEELLYGTVDKVIDVIVKEYKRYIMRTYFY